MTTIPCGSGSAPIHTKQQAEEDGYRIIGACRRCGFVTVEHRFVNPRPAKDAFETAASTSRSVD
jgi:hypothetical protein